MIIKSVGGRSTKSSISKKAAAKSRITHTLDYLSRNKYYERKPSIPLLTNCASKTPEELRAELEAWRTLNERITDPVRHIILSPEAGDRILSKEEWQTAVDLYRKNRELGDAPYVAYLHTDGHDKRHPHHLHLMFLRIKSDGKATPDRFDSNVHRTSSREIESTLGLLVNAGAAESSKHNGRDRHQNRDRAAELQGFTEAQSHVNPDAVQAAIAYSHNVASLRQNLRAAGIEIRIRSRAGGVYAWSLRNVDGPKEWTSGSKLTPGNEFGWQKVQDQLDGNSPRHGKYSGKKFGSRMRGGISPQARAPRPTKRIDEAADAAIGEAMGVFNQLAAATQRRPSPAAQQRRRAPIRKSTTRPRG